MEVILKENYPSLGYVGDHVAVRGGFARNYLIPRGIAVEASKHNKRVLNHLLTAINAKKVKLRGQAQEFAVKLEAVKLEFTLKLGKGGKSFGSVTARDILLQLEKQGISLDRRQVRLNDIVKSAGEYSAEVKLHSEVTARVMVNVKAEKIVVKEIADEDDTKKRSRRGKKSEVEDVDAEVEVSESVDA